MIITKTPFRITLGGGGTDLPSYYSHYGGFIFAMGIDKYMYVAVNPLTIDKKIHVKYTISEAVNNVNELKHELAREALKLNQITEKFDISSMADLPAGTGLGSSSCYLVGLLNALHQYQRNYITLKELAEEACNIELDILQKGIGKQDQYMAVYGGLTILEIDKLGNVTVKSINLGSGDISELIRNTHIYYTGVLRNTTEILFTQNEAMKKVVPSSEVEESLNKIKELGYKSLEEIEKGNFDSWGLLLHEHWRNKRALSTKISSTTIDILYDQVRKEFGVLGGKIIGAGGGGFLMFYVPQNHKRLEKVMLDWGMPRLHYNIEMKGSSVICNV